MKTTNDALKKQLESSEIIGDALEGRRLWWLSFCEKNPGGYQFLGVAIVEANGFQEAIQKTWDLQINPGGEVKGWLVENVPSEYHNRLLSRNEEVSISKMMASVKEAPQTPSEMAAYRCRSACRIGRDALDEKIAMQIGWSELEFSVYNLLHAVEDLSMQLESYERKKLRRL